MNQRQFTERIDDATSLIELSPSSLQNDGCRWMLHRFPNIRITRILKIRSGNAAGLQLIGFDNQAEYSPASGGPPSFVIFSTMDSRNGASVEEVIDFHNLHPGDAFNKIEKGVKIEGQVAAIGHTRMFISGPELTITFVAPNDPGSIMDRISRRQLLFMDDEPFTGPDFHSPGLKMQNRVRNFAVSPPAALVATNRQMYESDLLISNRTSPGEERVDRSLAFPGFVARSARSARSHRTPANASDRSARASGGFGPIIFVAGIAILLVMFMIKIVMRR